MGIRAKPSSIDLKEHFGWSFKDWTDGFLDLLHLLQ